MFTPEKSKILADKLLHFWSKDLTVSGRTDKELGDGGMGYWGWGVGYSLCLLVSVLSSLFVLSVPPHPRIEKPETARGCIMAPDCIR